MRLRLTLLLGILLLPAIASAQTYNAFNGWCQLGGQAVTTQGMSSSGTKPLSGGTFEQGSGVMASYPRCTISVYITATTNLATIYSNSGGNALSNPFTANTDGSFLFWASPAYCYDVVTSSGSTTGSQMPTNHTYTSICGPGSGGGGATVNCPSALNGSLAAFTNPTTLSCDPNSGTDFVGNLFGQSVRTIGPYNGFYELVGGGASPGTNIKFKLPLNAFAWLVPAAVTTSYYTQVPGTFCAIGQVWQVTGVTTDGNGDTVMAMGCLTPGAGITFQTNTVNNASQTLLNLVAGSNITLTNTSGGNVTIAAAGASSPSALNPSAPTVTPKGTTGATTYTYLVVGCEDVNCTKTSAASATGSTSTGNASLTTSNFNQLTAYADTLYGYRFFKVCRTVGGATQGVIASGVGKQYNDTGAAGDSTNCATTYSTNNTVLDQHCLGASLPVGVNVIPGAPCGVNSPPTSPTAFDDEFAWTLGAPGDANNPQYQQLNYGTSSTSLTNGELVFAPENTAGSAIRMIGTTATMPSTPWEFELKFLPQLTNVSGSAGTQTGMCLIDNTGTPKAIQFVVDSRYNTGVSVNYMTNLNTYSSTPLTNPGNATNTAITSYPGWLYFKIKDDGTSYAFSWSYDGVNFNTLGTGLVGAFLGAPTSIGPCMLAINAGSTVSIDFLRRTQ